MLINTLLQVFLIILGIQIFFFILAFLLKTDKFTDFAYGNSFIVAAAFALLKRHSLSNIPLPKIILLVMVTLWGLRLSIYLLIRILKVKKDRRFDKIREDFWKFAGFWLFQAISIGMISLPVITLMQSNLENFKQLPLLALVGGLVWLTGFLIETIADQQKFVFLNNPENKGKFIKSGLWAYSRHPNYFGEILCWLGVFIYTMGFLNLGQIYVSVSPIYITSLLVFVSGLPPAEKGMEEKFGDDPEYQEYKEEVNVLIPKPF